VGTDLIVRAEGPDASQVAKLADISSIPAEDFSVEGRVQVLEGGYRIDTATASLGSLDLAADGFVSTPQRLVGSDLQIRIADADLSHAATIAGIPGLPHDPIDVTTRLRIEEAGYRLEDFAATVADIEIHADGLIRTPPELDGTELRVTARGSRLSSLNPYVDQTGLPPAPFSFSGTLRAADDAYVLDQVVAELEGNRAALSGIVQPADDLEGTDLAIEISGPDLGSLGELVAGFADLPPLPVEPFTLVSRLQIDREGYLIEGLRGTLGNATTSIDGRVGPLPDLIGTDLTVDADGPDASLIKATTGLKLPVAPFEFRGRIERNHQGFGFHGLRVRLGGYRAALDGSLGELPKLIGTDLEIHASGPDTNLYETIVGLPNLPDKPFTLDGRFSGTPDRFASRDFRLTFGGSDLGGVFRVDITGKPVVEARLSSHVLDFSRLRERLEDAEDATMETTKAPEKTGARGPLLIPDEPVALAWLQAVDADVAIRIDQLHLRANSFRDLTVDVHLEDGRLEIDRATAAGRGEGRLTGSLLLEPHHDTYRLETDISLRHIRLDPPDAVTELLERPPIDIDIDLEAAGRTPHELASSSNGALRLVIGKGIFDSSLLDLVTADILLTLLNTFNPFAKEDPTTELQCGVALLSFENGVARLEPMAFQSDKMTLLGEGKIDLATEKLNLRWVAKPRKGIGISASMVTNPYIKLGGTLADPSLELKPLEAVTSTGVAVATLGISLVAKGLFDRVTAEKKVCKHALEEIERRTQGSSK
jgi:hypothetical protein